MEFLQVLSCQLFLLRHANFCILIAFLLFFVFSSVKAHNNKKMAEYQNFAVTILRRNEILTRNQQKQITETPHFDVFSCTRKNVQKGMFFRYSMTPPHPTAKPSSGWLRVVVRKLHLVLFELDRTGNKATAKAKAYWGGGIPALGLWGSSHRLRGSGLPHKAQQAAP